MHLIRKYIKLWIMINGVVVRNEQDTPQGGLFILLLSNIMLDEELEMRGHKFCQAIKFAFLLENCILDKASNKYDWMIQIHI